MDFKCFFDESIDFVCSMTMDGYITKMNRRWTEVLGWSHDELMASPISTFLHPDDSAPCSVELNRILEGGEIVAFENRIMRKDGSALWVQWNLAPMGDGLLSVTARDIEDMVLARQRLDEQKQLLELAVGIAHVGHWRFDLRTHELTWSANTYDIFGVDPGQFVPTMERVLAMHHGDDRGQAETELTGATIRSDSLGYTSRIIRPNGQLRHIQVKAVYERDKHNQPIAVFGVIQDVTEHEEAIRAIEHAAQHDPLTGLSNRASFHERLIEALKRGNRQGHGTALILLDLDHFKDVNDALGHPFGDKLLLQVAKRLRENVRDVETIARLGGDEFAIVVEPVRTLDDVMPLNERLQNALSTPYIIDDREVRSGASIGIAVEAGTDLEALSFRRTADQLIANADIALYSAKDDGRRSYCVFNHDMRRELEDRQQLERELRTALAEDQLVLHYQPQVNLNTRRLLGFEALVRWRHPERGLLLPDSFLKQVKRNNLFLPMTDWVIGEACRQQQRWQEQGLPQTPIAVNIAPVLLRTTNLPLLLAKNLERYSLSSSTLVVEITEEALTEPEEARKALLGLRDAGIKIALDDFGAGYSSLTRLRDLPIDILKMDRSFLKGITEDVAQNALAEAIARLAKSLDLQLIVEGVETHAQMAALGQIGCQNIQGFLTGRPMVPTAIPGWVASWKQDRGLICPPTSPGTQEPMIGSKLNLENVSGSSTVH
ncbi:MAG: sensor domain-containing protein [Geminicoccaceae bacterium]